MHLLDRDKGLLDVCRESREQCAALGGPSRCHSRAGLPSKRKRAKRAESAPGLDLAALGRCADT
jgi:hypothetical protein